MYTSLDTQGRLSARLLSAQARSACLFFLLLLLFYSQGAYAHGVAEGDKGYIQEITGVNIIPFIYLGAKHMVTGYDHLLFLFGVIFFLYKMRDIGLYVSLFAIGHSTTLLIGTFFDISVSAYLIDAIIGLSVVYKALDNLGALALVWRSAQHEACDAHLWILPRFWSGNQNPGIRNLSRWPVCQPDCLQHWR